MNTVNIEEVLYNYKDILGSGCSSCVSIEITEMLQNVTGKANYLNHLGFLFNIINYIENQKKLGEKNIEAVPHKQWCDELKAENYGLKSVNDELIKKIKSKEALIETYNKCYVQQARLKNGEKIAYRNDVTIEEIIKLKQEGLTNEEIGERFNVSKATIYRRLKEMKNKMDKHS